MPNYNAVDKNSRDYQENLYKTARYNLIVMVIFTVVNLLMLLLNSNSYFLFSATIPYYLAAYGYVFDYYTVGTYTLTGLTMSAVFLIAYLVCWLLSAKRGGWLIAALVLFAVDTLAMGLIIWLSGDIAGWLIDILLHVWVIISLARGVAAFYKLKNMPQIMEPPQYTMYVGPELDGTDEFQN